MGRAVQMRRNRSIQEILDEITSGRSLLYGMGHKLNYQQRELVLSLLKNDITFTNSKAGTGKTTIAVMIAKLLYESGIIDNLLYIFAPVQENAMGHFPGSEEKFERYITPLMDALVELGEQPDKSMSEREGWVKVNACSFLRGATFQRTFVLIDEAQNFTKEELKRTISRVHTESGSKAAVIGHSGQIDLKNKKDSGFESCINHFAGEEKCGIVTLTEQNFRGWVSAHIDTW